MDNKTVFRDAKLCNYVGRSSVSFVALSKSRIGAHVRGIFTLQVVLPGSNCGGNNSNSNSNSNSPLTDTLFTFSISTESAQQCMDNAGSYGVDNSPPNGECFGGTHGSAEVNISAPIATTSQDLISHAAVTTTTTTENIFSKDNIDSNSVNNGPGSESEGGNSGGGKKKLIPLFNGAKKMPLNKSQKNLRIPPPPPQVLGTQEAQSEKLISKLTEERDRMGKELEDLKKEVDELKSMNAQLVVESSSVAQIMNNARKNSGPREKEDSSNSSGDGNDLGSKSTEKDGSNDNNNSGGNSHLRKELANLTREQLVERVLELSESLRTTASFKGLAVDRMAHTKKKLLRLQDYERKYIKLSQSYKEQGLFLKVLQEENSRLAIANRECRLQQRIIEKLLPLVPESALPAPYAMAENIQALGEFFDLDIDGDDDDNDNNEFFNDDDDDDDNNVNP